MSQCDDSNNVPSDDKHSTKRDATSLSDDSVETNNKTPISSNNNKDSSGWYGKVDRFVRSLSYLFADDESKAYYEKISLVWAPISLLVLLVLILGTPVYKHCDRNSFLFISIMLCLPGLFIPLRYPCAHDLQRPIHQRFWFKANIWIVVFTFYGNYFWTHYFYNLLGARYLFDSYYFNGVPVVTYICTYFYFTFYFSFINVALRSIHRKSLNVSSETARSLVWYGSIAVLSYVTALFEAVSIQHFPLYTYTRKDLFFTIGSVVYALYFVVGFPMFFEMDERHQVGIKYVVYSVFAACAMVTLLLDLWRLFIGSIYDIGSSFTSTTGRIPFIEQAARALKVQDLNESVLQCMAQAANPSVPPTPVTEYVYVQEKVTAEACMEVLKGWASGQYSWLQETLSDTLTG